MTSGERESLHYAASCKQHEKSLERPYCTSAIPKSKIHTQGLLCPSIFRWIALLRELLQVNVILLLAALDRVSQAGVLEIAVFFGNGHISSL
jgi:hypothetical protein